ncbi:MAG: PIN domain nuclease [Opitutus sp.]|nr:PIN domain nuclease [Opitutus sp.]
MRVLADTPVWSAAFRRARDYSDRTRRELEWLIEHGAVTMIGPIRQELLSGIRTPAQVEEVRAALRHFPDQPILAEDYERAAEFFNTCRAAGVQGSMTDFLICAVASRHGLEIFTTDADFGRYRGHLPIALYAAEQQ